MCVYAAEVGGWGLLSDGAEEKLNFAGPLRPPNPTLPSTLPALSTVATSFGTDANIFF